MTGRALYAFDDAVRRRTGMPLICGVDEVGRGCLAGPLIAAAVVIDTHARFPEEVCDSKRMTPRSRERVFPAIIRSAVSVGLSVIGTTCINRVGLAHANITALIRAADAACGGRTDTAVIVDGLPLRGWNYPHQAVVHGDRYSAAVAAASVIAKVLRDRLMRRYDRIVPCYGFRRHVGYGTAYHRAAIQTYGVSEFHRYYAR